MLLLVYRSIITVILLLVMVGVELAAARGIVAFLGHNDIFVLSTFAINMLVFLAIAAGTDYGIFFFGRYQEARQAGEDRETAYYTTYRGVAPVVLAFRFDDRRGDLLPELYPAALLPDHGRPVRSRHARRGRGRGDVGSGGSGRRQSVRAIRSQAQDRVPSMAPDRHGDRPLARAHSGRDACASR